MEHITATEILICPSCGKIINVEATLDLPSRTMMRIERKPETTKAQ